MPKLDIATVLGIMQDNETPPLLLRKIEQGMKEAASDEEEQVEQGPVRKYEPLLVMTGDSLTVDSPFFVLDYDTETMNHEQAVEALKKAIWEHNEKLRGKKKTKLITTIGGAFQFLAGVQLKALGLKIRYRQPVIMVSHANQLPEQDVA